MPHVQRGFLLHVSQDFRHRRQRAVWTCTVHTRHMCTGGPEWVFLRMKLDSSAEDEDQKGQASNLMVK
jgi:hypothetical protein